MKNKYTRKQIVEALNRINSMLISEECKLPGKITFDDLKTMSDSEFKRWYENIKQSMIRKGGTAKDAETYQYAYMAANNLPEPEDEIEHAEIIFDTKAFLTSNPQFANKVKYGDNYIYGKYVNGEEFIIKGSKPVLRWWLKGYDSTEAQQEYKYTSGRVAKGEIRNVTGVPFKGGYVDIVRRKDGFYLEPKELSDKQYKHIDTPNGVSKSIPDFWMFGPFTSKISARRYAIQSGYEFNPPNKEDKVQKDEVKVYNYPMFKAEYLCCGKKCVDVIIAETKDQALKRFFAQYYMFIKGRQADPYAKIKNEKDIELRLIPYFKNIVITQLNTNDEKNAAVDEFESIGNPITSNDSAFNRFNKNVRFILGPDEDKTKRSNISINYAKFVKEDDEQIRLDESLQRLLFI